MPDRPPDILQPDPQFDRPIEAWMQARPAHRAALDHLMAAMIRQQIAQEGRAAVSERLYALADQAAGLDALSSPTPVKPAGKRGRYSFLWANGRPWFFATLVLAAIIVVNAIVNMAG